MALAKKSFAIYKAEKASLSAAALALVNSRICLATSMATLTRALRISNLNGLVFIINIRTKSRI